MEIFNSAENLHYGIGVGLVIAAGFTSGLAVGALGLAEGSLVHLLISSVSFAGAHRGFEELVTGHDSIYDRHASTSENALKFGEEVVLTMGMFWFIGKSLKQFGGFAENSLQCLAIKSLEGRSFATKEAYVAALKQQMEIIAKHPAFKGFLKGGAFTAELGAFTGWEMVSGTYQMAKEFDLDFERLLKGTLSPEAWKERVLFLFALKAGGALAHPVTKALHREVEKLALPKKFQYQVQKLDLQIERLQQKWLSLKNATEVNAKKLMELGQQFAIAMQNKLQLMRRLGEHVDPMTIQSFENLVRGFQHMIDGMQAHMTQILMMPIMMTMGVMPGGGAGIMMQGLETNRGLGGAGGKNKSKSVFESEFEILDNLLIAKEILIQHDPQKNLTIEIQKSADLNEVAGVLDKLPKESKKINITLNNESDLGSLSNLVILARKKGIEIVVGHQRSNGHTEWIPDYRIVDGQLRILKDVELTPDYLSEITQFARKKSMDISIGKEVTNGHTEYRPQMEYVKTAKGGRKLILHATEKIFTLLSQTDKMDTTLFKGAEVEILGIKDIDYQKPAVQTCLRTVIRTLLWEGGASLRIGEKGELVIKSGGSGSFVYSFDTNLEFSQAKGLFSEYLAFESTRGLGIHTANDPLTGFFRIYFDQAMTHAFNFSKSKSTAAEEYRSYIQVTKEQKKQGLQWIQQWQNSVQKMLKYTSLDIVHRTQVLEVLQRIKTFSQNDAALANKALDGRARADNAFELIRIFEELPDADLNNALVAIPQVLGNRGNVELYGAPIGTIYRIEKDKKDQTSAYYAAENEKRLLIATIDNLNKGSPGQYRITIVPEDRFCGQNAAGLSTKTPDVLIEKLDANRHAEQLVTIDFTSNDPLYLEKEIHKTIEGKANQILNHKLGTKNDIKQGVIMLKLYKMWRDGVGSDQEMLTHVKRALTVKYEEFKKRGKSIAGIRVMILCEHDSKNPAKNKTYLLEYDRDGEWRERLDKSNVVTPGDFWSEPLPQVLGW